MNVVRDKKLAGLDFSEKSCMFKEKPKNTPKTGILVHWFVFSAFNDALWSFLKTSFLWSFVEQLHAMKGLFLNIYSKT